MRLLPLLLLSLSTFCARAAEDLNGIWKGTLSQGPGGCYPSYFLELQISFSGDRISGKAYDYYDKTHYVKMSFTGRYNAQTHRMVIIEDRVLEAQIPGDCQPCVKTYDLDVAARQAAPLVGPETLILPIQNGAGEWSTNEPRLSPRASDGRASALSAKRSAWRSATSR